MSRKETDETVLLERQKWFHRRRMAYISLFSAIGMTFLLIFLVYFGDSAIAERLMHLMSLLGNVQTLLLGIVMAYAGLATYSDVKLGGNVAPTANMPAAPQIKASTVVLGSKVSPRMLG